MHTWELSYTEILMRCSLCATETLTIAMMKPMTRMMALEKVMTTMGSDDLIKDDWRWP